MNYKKIFFTVIVLVLYVQSFSNWLLPYPRPAAYDYSEYYDSVVAARIQTNVISPKEKLATAWEFYAKTFIMDNGLVRHLRMSDDKKTVIGQNEAVSEGIGYGMLLALICNDQSNFNKIFEGANAHMWNKNGHQSYDCWSWSNGNCVQRGAATDADLDIALALVFADKLQQKKLWNSYNKNGITYNSRALQMIKSIKETMVSGDLLLPGDSWGGDGFNNINPSYFSVAAMRIFNAYQSTHDFTGVINKCYSIIESGANYNKGQAADWCNSSGGQAGKYYGMSIEAIRVPWRIGLDALWFNDAKAIKYCQNTKNTLTKYGTDDVFDQMIEYKPDGSPDMADPNRQADNFERIAMWSAAALGSKDKSYTKGIFIKELNSSITSKLRDYFGLFDSDANFYYKQSLGMLGYATIFGMFPNVLADMDSLKLIDTVHITTGLKASSSTIKLPGSLTLSAKFDKAASWELILTGETSDKSDTLKDSTDQISVVWDGTGWFTEEKVNVSLSVENLSSGTAASLLSTQFTISEIVPVFQKSQINPKSQFFSIYQTNNSLFINAGNYLLPKLKIYNLSGKCIIEHSFNMNTRYADNHQIPLLSKQMTPGQYIAVLLDESGKSTPMTRRFIWQ